MPVAHPRTRTPLTCRLALLTALLVLFRAYDQVSGPSGILTFPEALWELSLAALPALKEKYERAASSPWLPMAPDPPEP